ncbi:MAG: penicillin-binding protein 2 [Holosporales bacterium]|jgi:penicillin-binding protein 2|nr:penicillin-binding protein 2 [Holosporales bacterium]
MRETFDDFLRRLKRRRRWFLVVEICAFALIFARLSFLQFIEDERYSLLSQRNCVRFIPILPQRGDICDKNGKILATNAGSYRLFLENPLKKRLEHVLTFLHQELALSEAPIARLREESLKKPCLSLMLVRDGLSWEEVSRLAFLQPIWPELYVTLGYSRAYPYDEVFGHVTGYVGLPEAHSATSADAQDIAQGSSLLLKHPDYRTGKTGLERTFNSTLLGKAGFRKVEVNAAGKVIRQLELSLAEAGTSLKTTLDADLQAFAYALLKPYKVASCVIIEVPSGAVRCLVSVPSYSPMDLSQGKSSSWQKVLHDPNHSLLHRAIAGQYPPASPFKIVTALAALEAGIVSPKETVFCPGYFELGNHKFHCWNKFGHGAINLAEAICKSCDVYFFSLAGRLGIDRIATMAQRLGFGELTGISLYGEKKGLVPSRSWKFLSRQEKWSPSDTILVSVGQGPVLATPLQLATFIAHIANKGMRVHPTLIEDVMPPLEDMGFRPETIAFLQRTLIEVCTTGTGRRARPDNPAILVAGKTGTAQVRSISSQDRASGKTDTRQRPWNERDHSLFVGYAPADDPRYALAIIVEHGGKGGEVAASLAKDLFEKLLTDAHEEKKTHAPPL